METVNAKLGFFDQIIYSVQPKKYGQLAAQSKIRTIIFAIIIAVCLAIMNFAIPVVGFSASVQGYDNFVMEVLPDIELKDGKLNVSHKLEIGEDTVSHILVDTTIPKVTEAHFDEEKYMYEIIVGQENVMLAGDGMVLSNIEFSQFKDVALNNEGLLQMKSFIQTFLVLCFCTSIFSYLANYLFAAAFLALICWGPFRIRGAVELKYTTILMLAIYAKAVPELVVSFNATADLLPIQYILAYASIIATVFLLMNGIRGLGEKKQ